jgi:oligopeptide transport system substrate-binding protein
MQPEKRSHKSFLLLLLCFLASLVIACTDRPDSLSVSHQMAPADQQILRLPIGPSDFDTLDPALAQTGGGALQAIFTGLVEFDQHVQVRDQLASSHKISADGLVWTFHLRPHLRFSDGTLQLHFLT